MPDKKGVASLLGTRIRRKEKEGGGEEFVPACLRDRGAGKGPWRVGVVERKGTSWSCLAVGGCGPRT